MCGVPTTRMYCLSPSFSARLIGVLQGTLAQRTRWVIPVGVVICARPHPQPAALCGVSVHAVRVSTEKPLHSFAIFLPKIQIPPKDSTDIDNLCVRTVGTGVDGWWGCQLVLLPFCKRLVR